MANELTDEAKAEIAAAIAIVREDKILAYMRGDGPKPPDGPPAPPKKDEPPEPPKTARKGLWWGDQLEDGQPPTEPPKPPEEPPNA